MKRAISSRESGRHSTNGRPPERIDLRTRAMVRARLRSDGTLELVIYGAIGEDFYGEGVTSNSVKAQLDSAGDCSKILVLINSPGGDAFEGVGIYNILRRAGKPIDVRIDGIAASAASIIAMAGDSITMGPNTMMMIHNAWAFCIGDAGDMSAMAQALKKISTSIAQTYVVKTAKALDEVQSLMDAETWLTAQECVEQGFATGIVEEPEEAAALARARQFKALGRMKHVPAQLRANLTQADQGDECGCDCGPCLDGRCADCENPECDDPNCEDCPVQQDAAGNSNLSLYEARTAAALLPANRR